MRGYFSTAQISDEEKSNILDQHRTLYNGYQTMQPKLSNTQPLYVQDFAKDKEGMIINNKGEIKKNTNFGINEQWQAAAGRIAGAYVANKASNVISNMFNEKTSEDVVDGNMCECGGNIIDGVCEECGGDIKEDVGRLDNIYDESDLNPEDGFDYIEGESNNVDTFKEVKEQGGNADDMDVDDVKPAFDFESNGPMDQGDVFEEMESAWSDEEFRPKVDLGKSFNKLKGKKTDEDGVESFFKNKLKNEKGEDGELEIDFDKFDPRNKSWAEIQDYTGDYTDVDEDMVESLIQQKNRITEMIERMKRF